MNSLILDSTAQALVSQLAQTPSVQEVWLIGSRVNSSAAERSDWDLLVFSSSDSVLPLLPHEGIDVLRVGPSGQVLLQGQPENMSFPFEDLAWRVRSEGRAQYLGRKFIEHEPGVARDASEPAQVRRQESAIRLWPTTASAGTSESDA